MSRKSLRQQAARGRLGDYGASGCNHSLAVTTVFMVARVFEGDGLGDAVSVSTLDVSSLAMVYDRGWSNSKTRECDAGFALPEAFFIEWLRIGVVSVENPSPLTL